MASVMDIDDRSSIMTDFSLSRVGGDMLFAKTDEMSVSFYANLPLEVKQILRISGTRRIQNLFFTRIINYGRFQLGSVFWRN